jgi:hypothetical protein
MPAVAAADDPPAPAPSSGDSTPSSGDQAPASQPPAPSCLAAHGSTSDTGLRGVRVGVRAHINDADGKPLSATRVTYCVNGGGNFSFALSREQDVVLILSTAEGDAIGPINPTSPALSARAEFPKMRKLARAGVTTVYRVDPRRQLILGVAAGRVAFVGAADHLLLEYPSKLGYYLRRLTV